MTAPPAFGQAPGVSLSPADPFSPTGGSFGSNNPFRNRALSPAAPSTGTERPRSTNPFLDDVDVISPQSAPGMSTGGSLFSPVDQQDMTSNTRDLFENLSLQGAPTSAAPAPRSSASRPPPSNNNPPRGPPSLSRPPRERRDQEGGDRERGDRERGDRRERPSGRPKDPKDPFDIFADPPRKPSSGVRPRDKSSSRRPRRNSESSVMDRSSRIFDDDDEQRRRERRRREREARHRERDGKPRSSRKNRQLDIIDKLDVTSIYGTGMFHHDGPFDACNPHRNRKGLRAAPMQAFPKGSANMALGGSGPLNSNIDLNLFHGRTEEGYNDFSGGAIQRQPDTVTFDATARIDPIHGGETVGLGTSTFLDGAPASRSAARRQSENEASNAQNGGLARKKSLAQRLRGRAGTGRMHSPTEGNFVAHHAPMGSSHSASSRGNEGNPFFQDYDEEWDKKGSRIEESRFEGGGRMRSSSSPKQATGLERKPTNDPIFEEPKLNSGGGGFLNRMKSLRKPRPERPRRTSSDQ
ncbi:hypothetical protein N7495_009307 [Penicillium taxi]|uniref:uncharacterized protein n=1 Tax=Penicillium taxi TaxID=168475 RepID=UPI002544DAA8|nr:uncharacterized protein N7495_009307 [Penicillium taxi]KAJ5884797.1 hypothetical protein N7495_009307 [Penicillium taxi]